jgi:osmotically-inducible protein OsmY
MTLRSQYSAIQKATDKTSPQQPILRGENLPRAASSKLTQGDTMNLKLVSLAAIPVLLIAIGCSSNPGHPAAKNPDAQNPANVPANASYKDSVKKALEQADLNDVTVTEDQDKNTITLSGSVHSQDAKDRAIDVAKPAAGTRIVANEISVEPVGAKSEAKSISSNVDGAIEKNYKAALISNGLNKQHIRYDSKNGVLTLKGSVDSMDQRQQAQQVAASVPNVQQVLNEIQVRR